MPPIPPRPGLPTNRHDMADYILDTVNRRKSFEKRSNYFVTGVFYTRSESDIYVR
jgi:hypothetical protein